MFGISHEPVDALAQLFYLVVGHALSPRIVGTDLA
jgi:hypothetical protein